MAEPVTVKLKTPVEYGSQTIAELTVRRGRFGDLRGVKIDFTSPALSMDDAMVIAGRMCGQPSGVIERIDEEDIGEVLELVMGFFGRSLSTGRTPSPS